VRRGISLHAWEPPFLQESDRLAGGFGDAAVISLRRNATVMRQKRDAKAMAEAAQRPSDEFCRYQDSRSA